MFDAINGLTVDELDRIVYIRNMGHTVTEAINRQLAYYPYQVGQIFFISKNDLQHEFEKFVYS